jgi:hypothetical protein
MDGLVGRGRASLRPDERGPAFGETAYARSGSSMFLEGLQPEVSERRRDSSGNGISHRRRHYNPPRLRNAFKASRNVDRRPEQIPTLIDHVSQMDADTDLEVSDLALL